MKGTIKNYSDYEIHYTLDPQKSIWSNKRNRWLKGSEDKDGYFLYGLIDNNGVKSTKRLHQLYVMAFIPNPLGLSDVHHINHDHTDNRLENLMWISREDHKKLHAQSEITKKKQSEALKGEKNHFYGKHFSEEHKKKLSEAKQNISEETRKKMSEAKQNISEITRKKMSEAHKGIPCSEQLKIKLSNPVAQYTMNGELIGVYESTIEASRRTGCNRTHISQCCKGGFFSKCQNKWVNVTHCGGYVWKYISREQYDEIIASQKL